MAGSDSAPTTDDGTGTEVLDVLRRIGLVGDGQVTLTPMTGGVSSDILLVDTGDARFVVKRALAKLRVAADWRAPVVRNRYELQWLKEAALICPAAVPRIMGSDDASGLFAMEYLPPDDHPVWKAQLRDGHPDPQFAQEVGATLVRIHSATAGRADLAARFATDHIFHPIRLEPYLEATAARHPDYKTRLMALSRDTLSRKVALVHGDVSPKNILCGPAGPVFLDAECAWYGDPAFDLAFCLNHMLLKCVWTPASAPGFLACFDALAATYLAGVAFENPRDLERRAAALLAALFLARVDGKSPVEYITRDDQRDCVRSTALPLIAAPADRLADVRAAWARRIGVS